MRIDKTNASLPKKFDDDESNVPTGAYQCELREVKEIGPKEGEDVGRLVFEFPIIEGRHRGKKLVSFCKMNLFAGNARGAKPSMLFKMLKDLGAADPMAGCDTDDFIGRRYTVVARNNDGKRAWPESIIPAEQPPADEPAQDDPF